MLTSDASHFYRNVERRQPVQIITNLPEMLSAFETIDALAGAEKLVVAGHDPEVADRFKAVEQGIIKIAVRSKAARFAVLPSGEGRRVRRRV